MILMLLCYTQLATPGFLLGLHHNHPLSRGQASFGREALEPRVLTNRASLWKAIASFIGNPLVMFFPLAGGRQKPNLAAGIDDEIVLNCVLLSLAAVVEPLCLGVLRTLDGTLCAIVEEELCFLIRQVQLLGIAHG